MSAADPQGQYTMPSRGWAGWVAFGGVMLGLVGFFDILQGLTALTNDKYFTVSGDQLLVFDFTTWGWIQLLWGVVLIVAGLGLLGGRGWARWFGVFAAFICAIAQIGFLAAFPIWSTIIIALCVFILFALTAHWDEAQLAMKE